VIHLVTGGARSGKSRFAQSAAELCNGNLYFVATAEARDEDMAQRVRRHQGDRGDRWRTVEAAMELEEALGSLPAGGVVVVDCLTMWCANLLLAGLDESSIVRRAARLNGALAALGRPVWVVTNEVGLGVVPDNALARHYRDALGRMNQAVAQASSRVTFLVAGIPVVVR
jgi:adenosylcobinamide kinase / adenosylcobinamide-phosphate guanylyltransferase